MTTKRTSIFALPLCGVVAAGALLGCEDAESRQRQEVQDAISRATQTFRAATLHGSVKPDDPEYAEVQRKFNSVVSDLSRVTGGQPGQQAAKELLIADSLFELAMHLYHQASRIEAEHRLQRGAARSHLAGTLRMEQQAAALAGLTTHPQRVAIQQRREELQRSVDELSRRMSGLQSPIGNLVQANEVDSLAVEQVREQADLLLREAMDLGFADGFKSYEESVALRRQADQIEYRIAQRQIELSLELQPERDLAQTQAQDHEAMLEAARLTLNELDEIDQHYRSAAASFREASANLRRQVRDKADALGAASLNELAPLYQQAAEHLERASNAASRAAGPLRGEGGAARMAEARYRESLGRVYWTEARGLDDHASLLESIVAAGEAMGDVSGYRTQLEAVKARKRERLELAQAAYTAAHTATGQVTGRIEGREAFQMSLQGALALLSGQEVPPAAPDAFDMEVMDAGELPFDPSMLDGIDPDQPLDPEMLIAALDELDFDAMVESLPPGMGLDDPQVREVVRRAFNQAKPAVRMQIQRGEVTTIAELMQAFQQAVMQRMMGG